MKMIPNAASVFLTPQTFHGINPSVNYTVTSAWLEACGVAGDALIAAAVVDGKCMEPTLKDGDLIAFDRESITADDLRAGGIFVFTTRGNVQVKRLRLVRKTLHILQDAWLEECRSVPSSEMICMSILGRVFWTGKEAEIGTSVADLSPPEMFKRIAV